MSLNDFNPQEFGLKIDNLYEILATTFSKSEKSEKITPNTACMGIKLINDNQIMISPYPNTRTFKNLKENGLITINFVDDVYLYALAALKEPNSTSGLTEFPMDYYDYQDLSLKNTSIPYISSAWAILTCKVEMESQKFKRNGLGEVKISEFSLRVLKFNIFKKSYKLFNRAENLALESIVIATRLKVAKEINNNEIYEELIENLKDNIANIERFGKNAGALKTIDIVRKYVERL